MSEHIADNFHKLRQRIEQVAVLTERNLDTIQMIAVSKGQGVEAIKSAYAAGCRDFAESRVQEALDKIEQLPKDIRWHFIGNLQKNKISKILSRFYLIHSVDTPELLHKIGEASEARGLVTSVLLEVNTSAEASKHGLSVVEWQKCFPRALEIKGVKVEGLMTMAPLTQNLMRIRTCFSQLRCFHATLREHYAEDYFGSILSMGMSQDFSLAIEEGATHLRIGTALFADSFEL